MIGVNQHLFIETHHAELAHNSEATHVIPASSLDKSSILMSVQHWSSFHPPLWSLFLFFFWRIGIA